MKKFLYLWLSLIVIVSSVFSITVAQNGENEYNQDANQQNQTVTQDSNNNWDWVVSNPMDMLDSIKHDANKRRSDEVQNTKLDNTISECDEVWVWLWFTITKTICNIKKNIHSYLQYAVFAWLTLATIFIIRNGFQLVTSSDRGKQMWTFKNNIIHIIIWVVLLISFYYILDIFVTLVNFVTE